MEPADSAMDWQCAVCTFMNAASSQACDMCGSPAPHASSVDVLAHATLSDGPTDVWVCTACTYAGNSAALRSCEICGSSRPRAPGDAASTAGSTAQAASQPAAVSRSGFPDVDVHAYFSDDSVEELHAACLSLRTPDDDDADWKSSILALQRLMTVVTVPGVAPPVAATPVVPDGGRGLAPLQSLLLTLTSLATDAASSRTRAHAMAILRDVITATGGSAPALQAVMPSLATVVAHSLRSADDANLQLAALAVARDVCALRPDFISTLATHGCLHDAARLVRALPPDAAVTRRAAWLLAAAHGIPAGELSAVDAARLADGILDGTDVAAQSRGAAALMACAAQLNEATRTWLVTPSSSVHAAMHELERTALASLSHALSCGEVFTPFQVAHSGVVHALHAYTRVDVRVATTWDTLGRVGDAQLLRERTRRVAALVETLNAVVDSDCQHAAALHSLLHACIARVCEDVTSRSPLRLERDTVPLLPSQPHWRPWNVFDHVRAAAGCASYAYAHLPANSGAGTAAPRLPASAMLRTLSQPLAIRLCGHAEDPVIQLLRLQPLHAMAAASGSAGDGDSSPLSSMDSQASIRVIDCSTATSAWVDPLCSLADVAAVLMRSLTADVAATRATLAHAIALCEAACEAALCVTPVGKEAQSDVARPRSASASAAVSPPPRPKYVSDAAPALAAAVAAAARLTSPPVSPAAGTTPSASHSVGHRVFTPFRVRNQSADVLWYGGTVTRVHDACAFVDISYDDGDARVRVPVRDVLTHSQLVDAHTQLRDGVGDDSHRFAEVTIAANRAAAAAASSLRGVQRAPSDAAMSASIRRRASPPRAKVDASDSGRAATAASSDVFGQLLASARAAGGSADINDLMRALSTADTTAAGRMAEVLSAASAGWGAAPSAPPREATHAHVSDEEHGGDGDEGHEEHEDGQGGDTPARAVRVHELALEERNAKDRGSVVVSDGTDAAAAGTHSSSEIDQHLVYADVLDTLHRVHAGAVPQPVPSATLTAAIATSDQTAAPAAPLACDMGSFADRVTTASRARAAHAHALRSGRSTWWMSDYDKWLFGDTSSTANSVVAFASFASDVAERLAAARAQAMHARVAQVRRVVARQRGDTGDAAMVQRASILAGLRRVAEKDDPTLLAPHRRDVSHSDSTRGVSTPSRASYAAFMTTTLADVAADDAVPLSAGTPASPAAVQASAHALELRAHELFMHIQRVSSHSGRSGDGGRPSAAPSRTPGLPHAQPQLVRADTDTMANDASTAAVRVAGLVTSTVGMPRSTPPSDMSGELESVAALTAALERDVRALSASAGTMRSQSSAPQYVLQRAHALLQHAGMPAGMTFDEMMADGSMLGGFEGPPATGSTSASAAAAASALIDACGGATPDTLAHLRYMLKQADAVAVRGVWVAAQPAGAETAEVVWGPSLTSFTVMERLGIVWTSTLPIHAPPADVSLSSAHAVRSHAWDSCSPLERTYTLHYGTLGPHHRQQLPVTVTSDDVPIPAPRGVGHDLCDTGGVRVAHVHPARMIGASDAVLGGVPRGGIFMPSSVSARACAVLNDAARAVRSDGPDTDDYVYFARLLHVLSHESAREERAATLRAAATVDASDALHDQRSRATTFPRLSATVCDVLRIDNTLSQARACAQSFNRFVGDDLCAVACTSALTQGQEAVVPANLSALLNGSAHVMTRGVLPLQSRLRLFSRAAFGMTHALMHSTTREQLASTGEEGSVFAEYGFVRQQQKAVVSRRNVINSARTLLGPREVVLGVPLRAGAGPSAASLADSGGSLRARADDAVDAEKAVPSLRRDDAPFAAAVQKSERTCVANVSLDGVALLSRRHAGQWTRAVTDALAGDVWYALSDSHELAVQFTHEEGHGLGPTLEFYATVARELAQTQGLWYPAEADSSHASEAVVGGGSVGDEADGKWEPAASTGAEGGAIGSAASAPDAADGVTPGARLEVTPSDLHPFPLILHRTGSASPQVVFMPSPLQLQLLQKFDFMGRFVAKALRDQRLFSLPLSAPFLRAIMGGAGGHSSDVCVDDLRALDATLHGSILSLVRLCNDRDALVAELQDALDAAAASTSASKSCGTVDVVMGNAAGVHDQPAVETSSIPAKVRDEVADAIVGPTTALDGVTASSDAADDALERVRRCVASLQALADIVDGLCLDFQLNTRAGTIPLVVRPGFACSGLEAPGAAPGTCAHLHDFDAALTKLREGAHDGAIAALSGVRDGGVIAALSGVRELMHRIVSCAAVSVYSDASGSEAVATLSHADATPEVTLWNLHVYIAGVTRTLLQDGIAPQVAAFSRGFAVYAPGGVAALNMFAVEEAQALLSGGDTLTDDALWRADVINACVVPAHGYTRTSSQVQALCEVVSELDVHHRRLFLRFITGAARLPHGGFSALAPPLTVVRAHTLGSSSSGVAGRADDALPTCSTCQVYLKLPPYSCKEVLRVKLMMAISEGQDVFAFD